MSPIKREKEREREIKQTPKPNDIGLPSISSYVGRSPMACSQNLFIKSKNKKRTRTRKTKEKK